MNLTDLVVNHLPKRKGNPKGGFYICCPMCIMMGESRNDTKFRGGFTPQVDGGFIYHCHNCSFATGWEMNGRVGSNLMKFMTTLGVDSKQIPIGLRLLRMNEKVKSVNIRDVSYDVEMEFEEVKLPNGAHSFESWVEEDDPPSMFYEAFQYLESRGTPVFDGWTYFWTKYNTYYGDDDGTSFNPYWNERIIIPFYHHRKIVGYTGRIFTDRKGVSKYFNKHPEHYMFNQDKLEGDKENILLVEGVPDAISIKGVAVMGNTLSEKQINLLKYSKKRIILIPDRNDAGEKLLNQVLDLGWEVSIPDWDRGISDCADATKKYGRLYTLASIYDAVTTDKIEAKIRFGVAKI